MDNLNLPEPEHNTPISDCSMMVMLVDDQAMVGEAVRRLLADEPDMDFHYCADPREAIRQADIIKPTVILQDLVMPEMDGLDVVRLFRSNPTIYNTPIIVLSTREDAQVKSQAFTAGANDYLVKLPDKIELVARIRYHSKAYQNLLQRDEAYRALRESQQHLLESNTALTTLNRTLEETVRARDTEAEARHEALLALRESEEQLRLALEAGNMGTWDWNLADGTGSRSERYERFYGFAPGSCPSNAACLERIHPQDREMFDQAVQNSLQLGMEVNIEYRVIWPDTSIHWLAVIGHARHDGFGPAVRLTGVITEITERKQAETALREAKAEAERANHAKSEFLSRMSHELRTPMNAILGFAQLLQMDNLAPGQHGAVEQILKGGRHLLVLINEVLDITRIEAGRIDLSLEPVPVAQVLKEAADLIRPLADQRGVRIRVTENCERHVQADRQRLKQVFLNLLSNAVKYNREGGSVTTTCEEVAEQFLRIGITDTGLGILPQDIEKLFTPFERLNATQTTIEGTGLGLALSKRLIEAMGGLLRVESTVGHGTTLLLELPLVENPLERHEGASENALDKGQIPASDAVRTVLYIEDNISNLNLIERILKRQPNVTLLSAMQGRLGLDLARQHRPDLVLLDLHLPDMDGDEVLRRLQVEPETCAIPVVILSADASPGQIQRLREAGAVAYLTKPLDVPQFLEVMDEHLQKGLE